MPRAEPVPPVERQKARRTAGEPGRHGGLIRVYREMDYAAAAEGYVLRVPILAVLLFGILHVLPGERVLQLRRRDRQPVDEEGEIQSFIRTGLVRQLPGNGKPVCLVAGDEIRRQAVGGLEEGEPDRDAQIHDPVPQHVYRPPAIQLFYEPVRELSPRLRLPAVQLREPPPRFALRLLDKSEKLREVQAASRVKVPGSIVDLDLPVSPTLHERVCDVLLEGSLVVRSHSASTVLKPSSTASMARPPTSPALSARNVLSSVTTWEIFITESLGSPSHQTSPR